MEEAAFISRFTEADMDLLLSASQATLDQLYDQATAAAGTYDVESGDMIGESTPLMGEDGSMLTLFTNVHLSPRRDQNHMMHGATLSLDEVRGTERIPRSTYEIWWRPDQAVGSRLDTYFELRSGPDICDEDTAQTLLGYLLPGALSGIDA